MTLPPDESVGTARRLMETHKISGVPITVNGYLKGILTRRDLRFLALVHDSLKYEVQNWRPKTGENHHAMRARRFAERYVDDERLLATIEQHDRPYDIWRKALPKGRATDDALNSMIRRIPDLDLFLRFVELDGSTEGKNPEPIRWLKSELADRGLLESG